MNILRRVLNLGGHEPASARDRLRTALANRDRAQVEFDEARQAVARVEEVIESARAADRSAVKSSAAAADAARAWAAAGADPAAASEFERLRAVAADAERGAQRAEFLADGARAGLGKVRDAQSMCEARLSNANAEVREANAMMVYVEENIAVKLVEREQLARQIEKVDIELLGFYRTYRPRGPAGAVRLSMNPAKSQSFSRPGWSVGVFEIQASVCV
jgi:chromosome segregation ATPase